MRYLKENHNGISTILSLALIPISGFATDIYVPSLPAMASYFSVSTNAIQLSLIIFMVSAGLSQLFVGSLLDSFGRFRLNIAALVIFALASFAIAMTHTILVVYAMRVIQGITVATIVVGKRAYFVDLFSGEKLRNYTSMFSIIWATAPIVAPFLGGYLQEAFGWSSNFWLLGGMTLAILVLELCYGGESLQQFQPFRLQSIVGVYGNMIRTSDFALGLFMLGLSYGMLVLYGLSSPFIIEHVYHLSPVVTGYCALLSGVSLMLGGITSRALIQYPFRKKIIVAILSQFIIGGLMVIISGIYSSIWVMMPFVLLLHMGAGFIFNNFFSYCLGRFDKNAGIASGITGGSMYIITSAFSYGIVNAIAIKDQMMLGAAYLVLVVLMSIVFILFVKTTATQKQMQLSSVKN